MSSVTKINAFEFDSSYQSAHKRMCIEKQFSELNLSDTRSESRVLSDWYSDCDFSSVEIRKLGQKRVRRRRKHRKRNPKNSMLVDVEDELSSILEDSVMENDLTDW